MRDHVYAAALGAVLALTGCAVASERPRGQPLVEHESVRAQGIPAGAQRVEVTRHVDGDTLWVRARGDGVLDRAAETRVRLLEIDTPESRDPRRPVECYAVEASRALARMLPLGATAWAVSDRDLLDPYDRVLLYLWTDRGLFVNRAMVARGFATAVLFEPNDRHIAELRAAEARARRAGRGLWGACSRVRVERTHSGELSGEDSS